jgi:hypothetical protein
MRTICLHCLSSLVIYRLLSSSVKPVFFDAPVCTLSLSCSQDHRTLSLPVQYDIHEYSTILPLTRPPISHCLLAASAIDQGCYPLGCLSLADVQHDMSQLHPPKLTLSKPAGQSSIATWTHSSLLECMVARIDRLADCILLI